MTEIRLPALRRPLEAAEISLRREGRATRLEFPASSETPVDRIFGTEVLLHADGAIRLDRVNRGAVPLLFNHDWNDPIGMIDSAHVRDSRLVVDAHLFETPRAAEVATMVQGGLRNVSIGYRLHEVVEDKQANVFRATDWEPIEVSIVSIPADATVGIGRDAAMEYEVRMVRASELAVTALEEESAMTQASAAPAAPTAETVPAQPKSGPSALELETARRRGIENLCAANKIDDSIRDAWIGQGLSLTEVSEDLLQILRQRGESNPQSPAKLGLTQRETQRFSILRAINAVADKNWTNAGFELECSRAVAKQLGMVMDPHKFFVPFEVIERPIEKRDLTVGTGSAGGFLVETQNLGFIEILRNRSVAMRMGATRLSGLQGNVTVPRQTGAATAYWLATEATAITESQQTFAQMALTPKTVGAYTEISRLLTLQSSPSAEAIVNTDLASVTALAVDLGVLSGSGASGQPTGITNTAGIGSVSGGSLGYAGVLEFQTDVAAANVEPVRGGYVTTPAVAQLMMTRQRFTSTDTPLWVGNVWDGAMSGFPAMSSNQMASATMLFGDWSKVVIAEWGVLQVEVNPYANFQAGIVGVRAMYTVDVGVRIPAAFSLASSIT